MGLWRKAEKGTKVLIGEFLGLEDDENNVAQKVADCLACEVACSLPGDVLSTSNI